MKLPLDQSVLDNHIQLYPNSCVTMCVELVLKLMHTMSVDSFDLQYANGDNQKSGADFHSKIINHVFIQMEFDIHRGHQFPLNDLFDKIKSELDNGNYVNCAWRPSPSSVFHAFVIYGYECDEFLAITKYHNDSNIHYIKDMKTRLTDIQGSDIITFRKI
jgi:hypothetical protein